MIESIEVINPESKPNATIKNTRTVTSKTIRVRRRISMPFPEIINKQIERGIHDLVTPKVIRDARKMTPE